MRATYWTWGCGIVLALTGSAQAGPREMALEIIDKAIKAHGGSDGLTRAQTAIRTGNAVQMVGTTEVALATEVTLAVPTRMRGDFTSKDKTLRIVMVLNGDRAWRASNGMAVELPKEALEELQEEAYVEWVATVVPLKMDGFNLSPADGKMVNGKPTVAVKVARKGHSDAVLYFDKDDGLLVEIERKTRTAGLLVNKEYIFSEFKEFNGVKLPTKRTELLANKKAAELTGATYRFEKENPANFAKP
jgi:hypothetical protein